MKYITQNDIDIMSPDELDLVLYVIKEHIKLDPIFIKSIKKKNISQKFLTIKNQLSPTGTLIYNSLKEKNIIE